MSDPKAAATVLLESLHAKHGRPSAPPAVRDYEGGALLYGTSVLDIGIRGAASDDIPLAHDRPSTLDEDPRIEHRFVTGERLRLDQWTWRASEDADAEQTLDVIATFVWQGDVYRLELFSNSCDFRKGLGRELPATLTWPSLLELVATFVGVR